MGIYIGIIEKKGYDPTVFFNFKPIAEIQSTRDDLEQLVKNRGQEAVGAAVVKIPDEDVRPALMLMVMIYQKSDEINREIFRRDQKRIAELEEELEKARAELHRLEQEK